MSPAAHVAGVLATCLIVLFVYFGVFAAAWRQTLGMRLAGVRLESIEGDAPTRAQGLKWGLVSAVVAPWGGVGLSLRQHQDGPLHLAGQQRLLRDHVHRRPPERRLGGAFGGGDLGHTAQVVRAQRCLERVLVSSPVS
jgi:hypothetical protein